MNLSFMEKKNGWWIETRSTVPCKVSKDGLVVIFNACDIELFMDCMYPEDTYRDNYTKVWYFNETRDREIAEKDGDYIVANPCVLWDNFLKR